MKRLLLPLIAGAAVALSGCGGNSACAQAKRDARNWANHFAQGLPNPISQKSIDDMAQSAYEATITPGPTEVLNGTADKYAGCS